MTVHPDAEPRSENHPPVTMPGYLYLLALVPPLASAVAVVASYDAVPDPMPTHWGFSGEPDAWAPKSMSTLLFGMLLGPVICVLAMAFAGFMMRTLSASLFERGGARSPADARRTWHELRMMQPVVGVYCVLLSTSLTLLMLGLNGPWEWLQGMSGWLEAVAMLGIVASTAWLLVTTARRGEAVAERFPFEDGRRRRWLIFVEIPGSDRVMVDTGTGSNFTFNVATRGGRIGAVVLLVVLAAAGLMLLATAVTALF
ncbi:DUF1648 domain-containing protein [Corynebacterium kalidii]|uniref:DUF1648 domain-containing protein n=1 Tax=Corynebacterium kalidii TaxID=2931982 RepID=A0A9X2B1K0_9CORY|nr:DUF1648 domain-containing protein [Corynebacterium kalidii]MCJ7858119.1 DUF1648 domain-containing protein [Corynebacterium kalidii]